VNILEQTAPEILGVAEQAAGCGCSTPWNSADASVSQRTWRERGEADFRLPTTASCALGWTRFGLSTFAHKGG